MAYNTEIVRPGQSGIALSLNRLGETARSLWRTYRQYRADRATIRTLQSLGDGTLHDIGIDRSEIESLVRTKERGRIRRG
jgi:uncharacterized protein YjiS (DUF1127 family)